MRLRNPVGRNGMTTDAGRMSVKSRGPLGLPLSRPLFFKLAAALLLVLLGGLFAWIYRDQLSIEFLVRQEQMLLELREQRPLLVYGVAFCLYVAVTGLSLPGATVLSLSYGWFFGILPALVLVSFASTTGATIAFLLSRFLLRDLLQRFFGEWLVKFNKALEEEGAFYLFTLRVVPAVPFVMINLVMGLTPVGVWTFWWVSQLGMLPGTVLYVYVGAAMPNLQEIATQGARGILKPEILVGFVLLGLFPLLLRWALKGWRHGFRAGKQGG